MYHSAPVNQEFHHRIEVRKGEATVLWEVQPAFFHAAGSLHGSGYFKMLDDAAFFACSSLEPGFFVLTTSFHLHFLRRVTGGQLRAEGKVIQDTRTLMVAESILYDERNREVARGSGDFVRSSIPLSTVAVYGLSETR